MAEQRRPADREELVINPTTGKLDVVRIFDPNRIVTHERNAAGTKLMTWDAASQTFIEDGPDIVIDQYGNVVTN
jgi:hypothetical protein